MRFFVRASAALSIIFCTDTFAYSAFDPRPYADLRELSTDRPDTTESPYTVDAGHFQLEWEVVSFGRDNSAGVKTETLTSSINLKMGLSDNIDAQLVLEPRTRVETTTDAGNETDTGSNDTEVRLKFNMWGNDDGDTAFAIMPFVRLPTHADVFGENGKTEGGVILPLAIKLPNDWDAAVELEINAVRNSANDGYVAEFQQSMTFGHAISGALSGFFEFVNIDRNEKGAQGEIYFDAGVLYLLSKNLQLDTGFNLGLTDAAQDSRVFVGISWRH